MCQGSYVDTSQQPIWALTPGGRGGWGEDPGSWCRIDFCHCLEAGGCSKGRKGVNWSQPGFLTLGVFLCALGQGGPRRTWVCLALGGLSQF